MDKALGVIGQCMLLQIVAALTLAITEDLIVQVNASRTVGSHLKHCKCCTHHGKSIEVKRFISHITDLTGTMYPAHGCNQVTILLYCLKKLVVIQRRYLLPQDRLEVCAHMCLSLIHRLQIHGMQIQHQE